jgi:hypothetical protein
VKVLASLRRPLDPQLLELRYFKTLSLVAGKSPPVLTDGHNAVYVGVDWTVADAKAFAAIRHNMPEPAVYDWDDATIAAVLARSEGDAPASTELDHERRVR